MPLPIPFQATIFKRSRIILNIFVAAVLGQVLVFGRREHVQHFSRGILRIVVVSGDLFIIMVVELDSD